MITDLRLQHFRSYTDASFELDNGVNIIVGPNASGKTNLLEAILVLAHGSSYRGADADLVQFKAPWSRLDVNMPNGARIVKLQVLPTQKVAKTFELDGQVLTRLAPSRTLPVVLFEPNHLLLLSGSPELRRNFIDDLIEQTVPGFGTTRRHYKRVLSQRNALLKKQPHGLSEQLFVWNLRLSELGGKIVRERSAIIARFAERMSELYGRLSTGQNDIALAYATQFPVERYETALLHKLESSVELEKLRGFTAAGPHRDDLSVLIDGRPAQETASRGETRTLVLALKILELQLIEELREQPPLLLLDDVFSELDGRRRQALTSFVSSYQTFITTTDADVVVQHFTTSNIIPLAKSDNTIQ
ncbi:MAG TPA: DNA replication/repair protein RecF [Candidatus Saccharimonadales bacterium]|nr:DNA replication/repair protein RecF [Candidatus Saccharimonadales bacterium]